MEPSPDASQEVSQELLKLLTPAQLALLAESIYAVRRSGGYGSVSLELRGGAVKYVVMKVRKEA